MHFWAVSEGGSTLFSPLNELVEGLGKEERSLFDSLYFLTGNGKVAHPLVYPHPVTGKSTMVFHCGEPFVRAFLKGVDLNKGTAEKVYDWPQTLQML
jgi:hypothetical protein